MCADREMTLAEYVNQLPECHSARKEFNGIVRELSNGTADLVAANISTIRDIHERTLQLIQRVCSESLNAHPHYPESYPEILGMTEKAKRAAPPPPAEAG